MQPANFCLPFSAKTKQRPASISNIYLIDFGLSHDVPMEEGDEPFSGMPPGLYLISLLFCNKPTAVFLPSGSMAGTAKGTIEEWASKKIQVKTHFDGLSSSAGTPDYAPSACLHEKKAFPKDDLESLVYTLLEMWNGELPWDLEFDIGIKDVRSDCIGWTSQQLMNMSKARDRHWDKLLLKDFLPSWILWLNRYAKALSSFDPISYDYCAMMLAAFRGTYDPMDHEE